MRQIAGPDAGRTFAESEIDGNLNLTARHRLGRNRFIILGGAHALFRDDMAAKGATVLNGGKPRIGAHGVPVIFVHPKDMGGVLVELMETPKGAH